MQTHGPDRKVFRNQETRFLASMGGIFSAGIAIIALWAEGPLPVRLAIAVGTFGLGTGVMLWWMRSGIYVDATGVEVRGLTTRRLLWSEISRFDLRSGFSGMVTYVDLVDGSSVRAGALNAGSGLLSRMNKRAQDQVDTLNQLLVEARGNVPPPPPQPQGPKKLRDYPGFLIATQGALGGLLLAALQPSMRTGMIAYAAVSFVGGMGWFWKQKRDEGRQG